MSAPTRALTRALSAAFSAALADRDVRLPADEIDPLLQPSRHADFQSNAAMRLGKRFGVAPRELADAARGRLLADGRDGGPDRSRLLAAVEVAGPGFLNLTLDDALLAAELERMRADPRLGAAEGAAGTVVVDYSSSNVAKEMHVGHLRSTVIGDACVRVLEWTGRTVVRRNHLGDWGTPFGMLIEHLEDLGEAEAARELSLGDLNAFYRAARAKFDASEAFRERARTRVVALQAGEPETRRLWTVLIEQSRRHFLDVYARIDVRLDGSEFRGESAYNDALKDVVEALRAKGLLVTSDGADCVYLDGFVGRDGEPLPLIVRKRDGGFGYAATDLAALRERVAELGATRLLYVVGAPQRQHFRMVFAAARALGWLDGGARVEHVGFGSVLGADGRMLASRTGGAARLVELLDEAVRRAAVVVAEKSPHLEAAERARVADAVGIGAVKYADLSNERTRDYAFDFDRMLALEGNTAPYLQYANARIRSLLRRADEEGAAPGALRVEHAAERELALALLGFADAVDEVAGSLLFHRLATCLHGLATAFSRFYASCPVLGADDPAVRDARLGLAALTGRTLETGLSLLGIRAPARM